jgi:hypothetical protein
MKRNLEKTQPRFVAVARNLVSSHIESLEPAGGGSKVAVKVVRA